MASEGDAVEDVILFSTLSILQLIKDAQQQHGLRHGDYQRYRGYCARRIRRIRKSLKFTNAHKSVPKHPAKFTSKKVNSEVTIEARYLLIPLFDAERSWAFAMQLKQELTAEEAPRKKFHMLSRLKKAVQHASVLESICKSLPQVDAHTKLEVQAYLGWMEGCLHFELQDWQKAVESFTGSKTIYEKLSTAVKDEGLKEVYRGRCAEMQPQLRYCAYSIGDESAMSDLMEMRRTGQAGEAGSDLDKLIAQTLENQASSVKAEAEWAGHIVPLSSPAKVHAFFNSYNQFVKDLAGASDFDSKMGLYEKLQIECRDAVQALRDETKNENLKTSRRGEDEGEEGHSQAQIIHSYLVYVRLSRTVERYLLMIENARGEGKKAKPQDLVRLYDSVIQNLNEMQSLPGAEADAALLHSIETQIACFRTYRCFYVGDSYAAQKKWAEALALFDRTLEHVGTAQGLLKKKSKGKKQPPLPVGTADMEELESSVNAAKHRAYASSLSEQTADVQPQATVYDKPLIEDLETYRSWNPTEIVTGKVPPLVKLPPDFRPMPCKPLFFDLALNHVKFPSLDDKMEAPARPSPSKSIAKEGGGKAEGDAEQQGGIGSVVKNWFWGGGK